MDSSKMSTLSFLQPRVFRSGLHLYFVLSPKEISHQWPKTPLAPLVLCGRPRCAGPFALPVSGWRVTPAAWSGFGSLGRFQCTPKNKTEITMNDDNQKAPPEPPQQQEAAPTRSRAPAILGILGVVLFIGPIIAKTLSRGLAYGLDFGNMSAAQVLGLLTLIASFILMVAARKSKK